MPSLDPYSLLAGATAGAALLILLWCAYGWVRGKIADRKLYQQSLLANVQKHEREIAELRATFAGIEFRAKSLTSADWSDDGRRTVVRDSLLPAPPPLPPVDED